MKYAIGFLLFAVACNPASPSTPSVPATTSSTTTSASADPSPVASAPAPQKPVVREERNITIENVEIANPLVISGKARTFENHVSLRARAADGTVIAEGFTIATGDMGRHNPYRGSLWLTREPGSRIVVEALEYSAKDGSETNLARVEKAFDVEPIESVLYFPDEGCNGVKPFKRRIPKSISMARLLIEALVHGPTTEERKRGAAYAFPRNAAVNSVNLRDGTLTVDFNESMQNVGGSCRAKMIHESLSRTLPMLSTVKKVVITAGGSEALALQP